MASGLGPPHLPGRATRQGTERLAARHREGLPHGYRALGDTGLLVSRIGLGGYRMDDGDPEHARALRHALLGGINLLDTSSNYAGGRSERLFGQMLRALVERGELARDEVVVVTKGGYLQGEVLAEARAREARGEPWPEMVRYDEGLWHCLDPRFLEDQIGRSLARLRLQTVDVYLLHNPEYFLLEAARRGAAAHRAAREAFGERLTRAFRALEQEVTRGRIACYGVSSNGLSAAPDDPAWVTLDTLLSAARAAAGEAHHLRVLQFPLNPLETRAATSAQGESGASLLEGARRHRLGVLTNRPLNVILPQGLLRLADPPQLPEAPKLDATLARVQELEAEFAARLAGALRVAPGSSPATALFPWGRALRAAREQLVSLEQWQELERGTLAPRLTRALAAARRAVPPALSSEMEDWAARYAGAVGNAAHALAVLSAERSRAALARLEPRLPPRHEAGPGTSARVLALLASLPGVDVVLLGMRRTAYVEEALRVLRQPPFAGALAALGAPLENEPQVNP